MYCPYHRANRRRPLGQIAERYGVDVKHSVAAPVLTAVTGRIGRITLNRPRKINALDSDMIAPVRRALTDWESAESVAAVVIDGAGDRGLCAGGDIAAVYRGIRGEGPHPREFWIDEYCMNLQIARYSKPVISLMDGLTLGGGIGIAAHASHRVVTETSQLAMPETLIGLSPDVGGLYLLARAPGELGTHAALTGARLGPGDSLAAGLADFFVPRADLEAMLARINTLDSAHDVAPVIDAFTVAAPDPVLWPAAQSWIDECYRGDDARAIAERLHTHADPAARRAGVTLDRMSPTAVAVTLRALRAAAALSLEQVLAQDMTVSLACAAHPDLLEGIRAQLIDKDRNPQWRPATLADLGEQDVQAFFER